MTDKRYYTAFKIKTPVEVTYQDGEILRSQLRKLTIMSEATGYGEEWKEFKKERRKRLTTLILREIGQKKCFQWVVDDIIKYEKGDFFKVYNPVNNKSRECRIVKVIEKRRGPITLILKRKDNGKHIKLKVTKDLISLWKKFYKEIKVGFEVDYVPKDGVGFIECVCVKILEGREKDKDKGGGILPKGAVFSEYAKPFVIPEYAKAIINLIDTPGKIISCSRGYGRNFMYNSYLKDHLARVARCKERSKVLHIIDEREKLKEFHQRPYFKTILETVKGKSLGKEDLSKMEFPCYCTYIHAGTTELGVIDRIWRNPLEGFKYILSDRGKQHEGASSMVEDESLINLMRDWKIEILKGELRLWKVAGKEGESKKKEK